VSERILWPLALVAGLLILDGTLAFLDRHKDTTEATAGGPIVPFDPAGVAKITLSREGKRSLVVSRAAQGAFVVATAKGFPARAGKVDATLKRLLNWRKLRIAGDKTSHEQFAVTPEKGISIKLQDFTGAVIGELIMGSLTGVDSELARQMGGKLDPGTMGRLVRRVGEDEVYVVQDFVTGELEPDPAEWIDRPLFGAGEEARVRTLTIKRGPELLVVHRDAPYLRLADGRPADPDRVGALVRELTNVWATDTADADDDAKVGLNPPRLAIQAELNDGARPIVLFLGDEIAPTSTAALPAYAARIPDRPGPLLVPAQAVAALNSATAESLALAKLLGEKSPGTIQHATLHEGSRSIAIARDANGWAATIAVAGSSSVVRKLDGVEGEALRQRVFVALTSLPIAAFDPKAPYGHGLQQPAFSVSLEVGKETIEIAFAAPEGVAAWARRSDLPCALALSPQAVAEVRAAFSVLAD
jgi:hypothetical protein